MPILWLGLLLFSCSAATVSPSVVAEISARGHAFVLVELGQKGQADVLNEFRLENKGICTIVKSWPLVRVMHVDATATCLASIRASASVTMVDLVGAGFIVAADSLAIPRYQRAAILGGGLPDRPEELREVFRQEACFCVTGLAGCCPGGVSQQLEQFAAARGGVTQRSTESLAFGVARQGHSNIIDGTNISLLAIRIAAPKAGSVSMAAVLDALNWLAAGDHDIGILVLSFESEEVYCGPCADRSVANRSMAAYLQLLRRRGIRIMAPDLGFQIRGAPACLPGVERFPASVDLPRLSTELLPLGTIVGAMSSISTFETKTALPALFAANPDLPDKVIQIQFATPVSFAKLRDSPVSSANSFSSLSSDALFQLVRGSLYHWAQDTMSVYFLRSGQVSTCSMRELVSDRANNQ
jgi:hypothetical protein